MSKKSDEELDKMELSLKCIKIRQRRTDHNETVPIHRLPIELFCMILEYLGRDNLFVYESVCKKWCYYVKGALNQRLPRHWFFSNTLPSEIGDGN